eukprot:366400-Chlamydomonas_euryale.AAC.21
MERGVIGAARDQMSNMPAMSTVSVVPVHRVPWQNARRPLRPPPSVAPVRRRGQLKCKALPCTRPGHVSAHPGRPTLLRLPVWQLHSSGGRKQVMLWTAVVCLSGSGKGECIFVIMRLYDQARLNMELSQTAWSASITKHIL